MSAQADFKSVGLRTLEIELDAVSKLKDRIDANFVKACELMLNCKGRVVVVGMGKSGHIGKKMAATLASTGTPAFFVHPGEASHGDMGMITNRDVVIMISNSGETAEVTSLLPLIKRMGAPIISMTGRPSSSLAQAADAPINIAVEREACPHDLAPTASTTVTLVMGDALAVALLEARGFTPEDFAFSHPGGALGRRLLLKLSDIMQKEDTLPIVANDIPMLDALLEVTEKRLGMTTVVDSEGKLVGLMTDGDLRRALEKDINPRTASISEVMTHNPTTVQGDMLAAEALHIMETKKFNNLIVVDDQGRPVGATNMHSMLRHGIL